MSIVGPGPFTAIDVSMPLTIRITDEQAEQLAQIEGIEWHCWRCGFAERRPFGETAWPHRCRWWRRIAESLRRRSR